MIFSTTAVRSLSSLLAFAMATITTPSGVGGATTMNRKLNKNSPTVTPTMKCRTATLYYPLASNNTLGSPHIFQAFPGPSPLVEGEEKICLPNSTACIGDTYINSNTLYADPALTQQVATLLSRGTLVNLNVGGGGVGLLTGSIFYEDTKAELIYGGNDIAASRDDPKKLVYNTAVFGGTQECALASGTIDFSSSSGDNYGSVEFHLVAH